MLVRLLADASSPEFWPLLLEWFPHCANMWRFQRRLLPLLRRAGNAYPHMTADAQAIFDSFDLEQYVLRGCASKCRRGLSWTTVFETADSFARWHSAHGRRANVYEAMIYRPAIFAVIPGGETPTILLDYARLRDIQRVEDRPTAFGYEPTFEPGENYRDENDDGATAELTLLAPRAPKSRRSPPLPPIENMRQKALLSMLAEKRDQLRIAHHRLNIASLEADIRRAERELEARAQGALEGRKSKKQATATGSDHHWGQKGKSPGRPTNASQSVTKPTLMRLAAANDGTAIPEHDKAA